MIIFGARTASAGLPMDCWGLLASLVAVAVYLNTLNAGFVYDDSRAVLGNPDLLPTTPILNLFQNDYWGTKLDSNNSHGSYRPLCVLSYRLNYQMFGFKPWGYHATNILLHALATWLVAKTIRALFLQRNISILTSLLFAVHPIHTENVAGIVGRADILSCIFFLLSFLFYLKHVQVRYRNYFSSSNRNYFSSSNHCSSRGHVERKRIKWSSGSAGKSWCEESESKEENIFNLVHREGTKNEFLKWFWLSTSIVMASCSTLCKETGITVFLACIGYEFIHYYQFKRLLPSIKKRIISQSLIFVLISMGVLFLGRLHMMSYRVPTFSTADNPTAKEPHFLVRLMTFLYLPLFNLKLLVIPHTLSFDWSMDSISRIKTIFDSRNVLISIFYFILVLLIKKSVGNLRRKAIDRKSNISVDQHTVSQRHKKCSQCYETMCQESVCSFHINNNTTNVNRNILSTTNSHVHEAHQNSFRSAQKITLGNKSSLRSAPKIPLGSNAYGKVCYRKTPSPVEIPLSPKELCFSGANENLLIVLIFLIFPFLPSSNLLFYVGFVLAERVLYIPSLGYCLIVAFGFHVLSKKASRKKVFYYFVMLLLIFGARTMRRNRDWLNEESLYSSGITINPPKAYGNLGSVLSSQGRIQDAEKAFRMALNFRPNMADVHYNLGLLLQGKGSYEEAIISYKLAIHYRPSLAVAYLNLGQLLSTQGKETEAEQVLMKGSKLPMCGLKDPKSHIMAQVSAMVHLGQLYMQRGEHESAARSYRQALKHVGIYPQPQVLYSLLGESLSHLGYQDEAERCYQSALQVKPDHVPAYLTYGKLLAKNRTRLYEAEHWFRRAKKLSPNDPQVYQHFGQFLCQNERYAEAVPIWIRATELAPDQNDLLIGAATALRQAGQIAKSEEYYRRALTHSPWNANSHSNLGAILHLQGKYNEAIVHYNEALRIEPEDQITLQNIQKLRRILLRRNMKT